jgi:hypothetical protein
VKRGAKLPLVAKTLVISACKDCCHITFNMLDDKGRVVALAFLSAAEALRGADAIVDNAEIVRLAQQQADADYVEACG